MRRHGLRPFGFHLLLVYDPLGVAIVRRIVTIVYVVGALDTDRRTYRMEHRLSAAILTKCHFEKKLATEYSNNRRKRPGSIGLLGGASCCQGSGFKETKG